MVNPARTDVAPAPVTHYENFPVASWLCPARLRTPIAAIYHFARTADDIADEGQATPAQRLEALTQMRADLHAVARGQPTSARWSEIFLPLKAALQTHDLPVPLLADLLDAFSQDVAKTRDRLGYENQAELLDYCRRSANPIGRLLLHLYGVRDPRALQDSDRICTALQLINFWQDLSVDIPRGRFYLPWQDCAAHGVSMDDLQAPHASAALRRLVAAEVAQARALMLQGAPLVHQIPGRAGWELRLVVQGGLRILEKIEALDYATLTQRPKLQGLDATRLLWRVLWM